MSADELVGQIHAWKGPVGAVTQLVWNLYRSRQSSRRLERMALVDRLLEKRVSSLEDALTRLESDPVNLDLFLEMYTRLITDDDDRKVYFHAAAVEWLSSLSDPLPYGTLTPGETRLVADAIKSLTFEELEPFPQMVGEHLPGSGGRLDEALKPVLRMRLAALGIVSQNAGLSISNLTRVGKCVHELARRGLILKNTPPTS